MTRLHWIILLFSLWAALYAGSFLVAMHATPSGDGFTRGMNRIAVFLQYQLGAGLIAVFIWWMGRTLPRGWRRWLARIPVLAVAALFLLIIGVIAVSILSKPGPSGPTPESNPPVTAPARPLTPNADD